MDDTGQSMQRGGEVEPANRAAVARQVFQMPTEPVGTRYELRDPFADVTYRLGSYAEITAKADQLGATRFYRVAPDGARTPVTKTDGQWRRPEEQARSADPSPKEATREGAKVIPASPSRAVPATSDTVLAKIDADAERAARVAHLETSLFERYVVKRAAIKVGELSVGQTEYRYRGDANRIAFTETTFRLAADNNNPSVIRSMIDVAEARNWQGVRVSGSEDFKRLVWLEASLRGVKALGYEPQLADRELLSREREARSRNRIEPIRTPEQSTKPLTAVSQVKGSSRGGGRKAVLAALEAVLVSNKVPERQREAVMAAASENLVKRLASGEVHKVKVYDKSAPSVRTPTLPLREIQRAREHSAPVR